MNVTTTPRARITAHSDTCCTVTAWDDSLDRMVSTEYWAPSCGGWVRTNADGRQVCEGLSDRGATLYWRSSARFPRLIDLIRRERRDAKRKERAFWSRF